jgi:sterol desaturase/sphingolipid hydroxylase (fatty acid hydroxylase superfamily)
MLSRGKNIRLFQQDWMERLTHVHPAIPLVLFLPIIGIFLVESQLLQISLPAIAGLIIVGLGLWTIIEYGLHRLLFHFTPRGCIQRRIYYLIHGIHHDDPNDATRLVMPPILAIPLASAFYLLFLSFFGGRYSPAIFAGFLLGYLIYDYSHFFIHHGRAKSKWTKYIKRHHLYHHHTHDGTNFGVSSSLWDIVFGTLGTRPAADDRRTAHNESTTR